MYLRLYEQEPGNAEENKLRARKEEWIGRQGGRGGSSTRGDCLGTEFSTRPMHFNQVVHHPNLRPDCKYASEP